MIDTHLVDDMLGAVPEKEETRAASRYETFIATFIALLAVCVAGYMNVFTPHDETQNPIAFDKSNPLWAKLDAGRGHITVEICYCSTLGECWTLRGGGMSHGKTTRTRHCPNPSEITFQQ